jgi:hypothetical protein
VVPLTRPVIVHDVVSPTTRLVVVVQVPSWTPPEGRLNAVAWASVIGDPPSAGTVQLTAIWPFSPLAVTVAAFTVFGYVAGVPVSVLVDVAPGPAALTARTETV